jgi:hypothetical protein
VVQSCLFEAKSYNRVLKNQWLASLIFPVLGNLNHAYQVACQGSIRCVAAMSASLFLAVLVVLAYKAKPKTKPGKNSKNKSAKIAKEKPRSLDLR